MLAFGPSLSLLLLPIGRSFFLESSLDYLGGETGKRPQVPTQRRLSLLGSSVSSFCFPALPPGRSYPIVLWSIGGPSLLWGEIVGVVTYGFSSWARARGEGRFMGFPILAALWSWTASAYTMNSGSGSSQGLHHADRSIPATARM
jgi:hypothetical protein